MLREEALPSLIPAKKGWFHFTILNLEYPDINPYEAPVLAEYHLEPNLELYREWAGQRLSDMTKKLTYRCEQLDNGRYCIKGMATIEYLLVQPDFPKLRALLAFRGVPLQCWQVYLHGVEKLDKKRKLREAFFRRDGDLFCLLD